MACVPDRGGVGEDRKDCRVIDDAPLILGTVEPSDGVTEELEGFGDGSSAVSHDAHMVVPVEAEIEVDSEIADGVGGIYPVFERTGWIGQPDVAGPALVCL